MGFNVILYFASYFISFCVPFNLMTSPWTGKMYEKKYLCNYFQNYNGKFVQVLNFLWFLAMNRFYDNNSIVLLGGH